MAEEILVRHHPDYQDKPQEFIAKDLDKKIEDWEWFLIERNFYGAPLPPLTGSILSVLAKAEDVQKTAPDRANYFYNLENAYARAVVSIELHEEKLQDNEQESDAVPEPIRPALALRLLNALSVKMADQDHPIGSPAEALRQMAALSCQIGSMTAVYIPPFITLNQVAALGDFSLALREHLLGQSRKKTVGDLPLNRQTLDLSGQKQGHPKIETLEGEMLLLGHHIDRAAEAEARGDSDTLLQQLQTIGTVSFRALEHYGKWLKPRAKIPKEITRAVRSNQTGNEKAAPAQEKQPPTR